MSEKENVYFWLYKLNNKLKEFEDIYVNPEDVVINIFSLYTYDPELDLFFSEKIVKVLKYIAERKNIELPFSDDEFYKDYIMVLNFKNILDLMEWGTSVRGCWIELNENRNFNPFDRLASYINDEQHLITNDKQFLAFITACEKFLKKEN